MKFATIFILSFLTYVSSKAQTPVWEPVGSLGGDYIMSVSTDGHGTIYAIFNDTTFLYRSTDNGNHWSTLPFKGCWSVSISPNGAIFLAIVDNVNPKNGGIYKSIDGGVTWVQMSTSIPRPFGVQAISDDLIYATGESSLFISKNSGQTWQEVLSGLRYDDPSSLPVSAGSKGEIIVACLNKKVCSLDTGKTWKKISDSVVVNFGNSTSWHFYKIWGKIQFSDNGDCFGVFVTAGEPQSLFLRSTDCGLNWSIVPGFIPQSIYPDTVAHVIQVGKKGSIYAFDEEGYLGFHSTDYGNTWNKFVPIDYEPVASALDSSGELIVTTSSNLYIFNDSSKHWIGKGPSVGNVFNLASDKKGNLISSVAFYTNYISGFIDAEGFYALSTDDGLTWNPLYNSANSFIGPRKGSRVSDIAVDSSNSFIVAPSYGFYRTTDLGNSWLLIGEGNSDGGPLTVDHKGYTFASNGLPFVSCLDTNKYYPYRKELWGGLESSREPFSLGSNINDYLFAGTLHGIYRLKEGDTSWIKCNSPYTGKVIQAFHSTFNGDIYAGSSDQGIFKSTDNGESWAQLNSGLPDLGITSIVGDSHGNIYVSEGKGVCMLQPNTTTWKDISDGLDLKDVRALTWSPKDELFAGTNGKGVYKISTSTFRSVRNESGPSISMTIYPNPVTGKCSIDYSLPSVTNAKIEIVDNLGRTVIHYDFKNSIAQSISLDLRGQNVAEGIYFVKLTAGSSIKIQKLVVMSH